MMLLMMAEWIELIAHDVVVVDDDAVVANVFDFVDVAIVIVDAVDFVDMGFVCKDDVDVIAIVDVKAVAGGGI